MQLALVTGGAGSIGSHVVDELLAAEHYLDVYAGLHGVETVALRYFNVYGERQAPDSDYAAVVPIFVAAAQQGEPLRIHGDGEQTRDFIHVSDVGRANGFAADASDVSGIASTWRVGEKRV